jgi:nucleotide-binding universal stress UspA family protein
MTDRHHILLPLDASEQDVPALQFAATTAARTGAAITVALPRTTTVLQRLRSYADGENLSVPDAAERYVENAAGNLQQQGVIARAVSWPSTDPAGEIASYAERHGADLVLVVGAQERRGRLRRGAGRLAAQSTVPVLVVPAGVIVTEEEFSTVVVESLANSQLLAHSA